MRSLRQDSNKMLVNISHIFLKNSCSTRRSKTLVRILTTHSTSKWSSVCSARHVIESNTTESKINVYSWPYLSHPMQRRALLSHLMLALRQLSPTQWLRMLHASAAMGRLTSMIVSDSLHILATWQSAWRELSSMTGYPRSLRSNCGQNKRDLLI